MCIVECVDWHCVLCNVQQLAESLDEFGGKWELNPGDGAFYGPKVGVTEIDIMRIFVQWKWDVDCKLLYFNATAFVASIC